MRLEGVGSGDGVVSYVEDAFGKSESDAFGKSESDAFDKSESDAFGKSESDELLKILLFNSLLKLFPQQSVLIYEKYLYFGYQANEVSLFAFGIDSYIEVLSASLALYHMICKSLPQVTGYAASTPLKSNNKNQSMLFSLETERTLTLFIGFLLIIFCLFAMVGGIFRLVEGIPPSSTMVGIIVGAVCIVAMFIMYYYKMKGMYNSLIFIFI